MAVVRLAGFEEGSSAGVRSSGGTCSWVSSGQRTGSYAFRSNPTTTAVGWCYLGKPNTDGKLDLSGSSDLGLDAGGWVGFAFKAVTLPAANNEPILYMDGVDSLSDVYMIAELRIGSDGLLRLYNDAGTLIATGATVIGSTYVYIEIKIIPGTGTAYEVRINGVSEFSGTSNFIANDQASWTEAHFGKRWNRNGQSVDFYYDDIYIDNAEFLASTSAFPEVRVLLPDGNGGSNGWTNGTGTTFTEVDDVPPDDDTTYIQASATEDNSYKAFTVEDTATKSVTGTIKAIQGFVRAKTGSTTGTSAAGIRVRSGTTNSDGGASELTTTYQPLLRVLTLDPVTGVAWTLSGLDDARIGMFCNTIAQTQRFTAAQIQVLAVVTSSTTHNAVMALSSAGSVALNARRQAFGVMALAGAGTVALAARATYGAAAALPGTATILPTSRVTRPATAAFAGTGTWAAAGALAQFGAMAVAGSGSMASTAVRTAAGAAAFAGAGTVSLAARADYRAAAAFAGSGTMAAEARRQVFAAAAYLGAASLAGTPVLTHGGLMAIQAAATVLLGARAIHGGVATLPGTGTLAANSQVTRPAAMLLAGTGTLGLAPGFLRGAAAAFAGAGAVVFTNKLTLGGAIVLPGVGTFTPAGMLLLTNIDFDYNYGHAWAVIYDYDDTTPLGVIPNILPAHTHREINLIGSFDFEVPAMDPAAALLVFGRYVRIYWEGSGLRFRGIIKSPSIPHSTDGTAALQVYGESLASELADENTYSGVKIEDQPPSTAFPEILARASAWTATVTGSGYLNQTKRYNYQSLFASAVEFGRYASAYVRETNTARVIELKNTFSASGLVLGNVEAAGVVPAASPSIIPLIGSPSIQSDTQVFDRVIARGRSSTGDTELTLQRSDRTTPYTIQNFVTNRPSIVDIYQESLTVETGDSVEAKNGNTSFNAGGPECSGENRAVLIAIRGGRYDDAFEIPYAWAIQVSGRPAIKLNQATIIRAAAESTFTDSYTLWLALNPPRGKITISGTKSYNGGLDITAIALQDVDQVNPYSSLGGTGNGTSLVTTGTVNVASVTTDQLVLGFYQGGVHGGTATTGTQITTGRAHSVSWQENVSGTVAVTFTNASGYRHITGLALNPAKDYYIEDATAQAARGGRVRTKILTDIQITTGSPDNAVALSNALYDYAANFLATHKNPIEFYGTQPAYLTNDTILPGDSLRFIFRGLVEEASGRRLWKDLDVTMIILAIDEYMDYNGRHWQLTLGTVVRELPGDASAGADLVSQVNALTTLAQG